MGIFSVAQHLFSHNNGCADVEVSINFNQIILTVFKSFILKLMFEIERKLFDIGISLRIYLTIDFHAKII